MLRCVADEVAAALAQLRRELLHRAEREQSARRAMTSGEDRALEGMVKADLDNTRRLAGVLDDRGWPGWKLAGHEGARAAWLLAPHDDHEPVFQRQCLDLLSTAVAGSDGSPAHRAYLTDRYS
jgi:hypothetical protein